MEPFPLNKCTIKPRIYFLIFFTGIILCGPLVNIGVVVSNRVALLALEMSCVFVYLVTTSPLSFKEVPQKVITLVFFFTLLSFFQCYLSLNSTSIALLRYMEVVIQASFGMITYSFLKKNLSSTPSLQNLPIATCFIVLCACLHTWFTTPSPTTFDWASPPFFVNIRHLTHLCVVALLLCPILKNKYFSLLLLTLLWAFLLWTGGRAGIMSSIVALIIVSCLNKDFRTLKYHFISIMVAMGIVQFFPTPYNNFFHIINKDIGFLVDKNINNFASGRITIWYTSIKFLLLNPLLGVGVDGFSVFALQKNLGHFMHPHNSILQFLLEHGMLNGSIIIYFIFSSTLTIWKRRQVLAHHKYSRYAFTTFIAYSLLSLVSGTYYHSFSLLLWMFLYACIFSWIYILQQSECNE